jgi:hypothetical protein
MLEGVFDGKSRVDEGFLANKIPQTCGGDFSGTAVCLNSRVELKQSGRQKINAPRQKLGAKQKHP